LILSFSVPDNQKYQCIIDWYKSQDSQERSREFRNIFLAFLQQKPFPIAENKTLDHISHTVELQRIEFVADAEEDFDSKLHYIGIRS
jgi:hypothetical protein